MKQLWMADGTAARPLNTTVIAPLNRLHSLSDLDAVPDFWYRPVHCANQMAMVQYVHGQQQRPSCLSLVLWTGPGKDYNVQPTSTN